MWIMVITILLNNQLQLVEVSPFGEWTCNIVAGSIKDKKVTLTNHTLVVQTAECKAQD